MFDGVGLALGPIGLFDIYGLWIARRLLIQDNLPLVDVLNEDSCGPGLDKP